MRLWLKDHPVSQILTRLDSSEPTSNTEFEVWRAYLNSEHFQTEVAYLADALTEAGISGNAERHRAIVEVLVKAIALGSSSSGHPEPLSSYYSFVKTWMIVHVDPSLQKQPATWRGTIAELKGLQMSDDDIGKVLLRLLSRLQESNYSQGLTSIKNLVLYIELTSIDLPISTEQQFFSHNWSVPPWSPLDLGTPDEGLHTIESILGDQPNREFWASLLFSRAWGNHFTPSGERADRENLKKLTRQWADKFKSAASNTWLKSLASNFAEQFDEPRSLILHSLFSPSGRNQLHQFPLGLRHQLIVDHDLRQWKTRSSTRAKTDCHPALADRVNRQRPGDP